MQARTKGILVIVACAVALVVATGQLAAANDSPLNPTEKLGRALFFNKISSPDRQSCADCHAPASGFTGPIPGINVRGSVYPGAIPQRFGNRKPPSAAYATLSPNFHYDAAEELFVGGNFWDGRATGDHLGNPAADQALGPFLNPVEQNNPSKQAVLEQIAGSKYAMLWQFVWGEPVSWDTSEDIETNYNRVGLAIAAYENSSEVNQFSSKWDAFMAGEAQLTAEETWGMQLFNGKALCSACHTAPLFTDFTYDNLGTPKNPDNPFYDMDEVYLDDGSPINPLGADWIDPGLGGFLARLPESYFTGLGLDKAQTVTENRGKHKVPTLRNVGKGAGNSSKAFMHNGVFKSLKEVVDFYNTRDVAEWPDPEVFENVNTDEMGDLGLTDAEVDAVVAFLMTLSDGYVSTPVETDGPATVAQGYAANTSGDILLTLPVDSSCRIRIFSVAGRVVRDLGTRQLYKGTNAVQWDGRSDDGRPMSRGVYFYQILTSDSTLTVKAVLTR